MALLMSMSAANLGLKAGHTHSQWLTLMRWQHAGDAGCPNTTALHELMPSCLSCLHWLGLNSSPSTTLAINIIPSKISTQKAHEELLHFLLIPSMSHTTTVGSTIIHIGTLVGVELNHISILAAKTCTFKEAESLLLKRKFCPCSILH